ncbi:MAG: hypothetical protein OHK0029_01880 [Armatimonadaceae bacterium]
MTSTGSSLSREEQDLIIGPLLARANLLRMRKQWEDAVIACAEALQKVPDSAPAHSLMGQIYEDQGRNEEAITWYGLAIELDPTNTADRARWDRLTQVQRTRLREQPAPAAGSPLAKVREKTLERTLNWLDRLFPPGQAQTIARYIYAVCGVLALVLMVSSAVILLALPRQEDKATPQPASPEPVTAPPVIVPPPSRLEPTEKPGTTGKPSQSKPETPVASPSPGVSDSAQSAGTTPLDAATMLQRINREIQEARERFQVVALQPVVPTGAEGNPNSGTNAVQANMDVVVGYSPVWTEVQTEVVRAAALSAYLAMRADSRIMQAQVRVGVKSPETAAVPVFQGTILRSSLQNVSPLQIPASELAARFRSLQWYSLPDTTAGSGVPVAPGVGRNSGTASPAAPLTGETAGAGRSGF